MIETEDASINVEEIMVKIRKEIADRKIIDPTTLSSSRFLSDGIFSFFDWEQVESNLEIADQHALAGTKEFTMLRFRKPIRWFAKFVSKAFQYVAQVITFPQNNFNQSILTAIRILLPGLRDISQKVQEYEIELAELKDNLITELRQENHVLKKQIMELQEKNSYLNTSITMQERRLAALLEESEIQKDESTDDIKLNVFSNEKSHLLDSLYTTFENKYRGTREEIKDRLKIYLPILIEVFAGSQQGSVLDIGCGRGEWLELLKEESINAKGVDLNQVLINLCNDLGFDAVNMDAFDYLKRTSDASLCAVSTFHFIEHIRYPDLIRLLDEILRVMEPGGIAIFETPNPENIYVGACSFYNDPSHLNPIPPNTAKFLLESRGYHNVTIMPLHPNDGAKVDIKNDNDDCELIKRFNAYFYGPQDYAVIGYKV